MANALWPMMIYELMDYAFNGEFPSLYAACVARKKMTLYVACWQTFRKRSRSLTRKMQKELAAFFNVDVDTITKLAVRDKISIAYRTGEKHGPPSTLDDVDLVAAIEWVKRNHPELLKNGGAS